MMELLTALGLVFLMEGALYALFPDKMKQMMAQMIALPSGTVRTVGLIFAIFGFLIIAVLRGF